MAQWSKTYSIAVDTLNSKVEVGSLKQEIEESSIIMQIDGVSSSDDSLVIIFAAPINSIEEGILDSLIAIHDGIAIQEVSPPINEDGLPLVAPTFEDAQGLTTVWAGKMFTAVKGVMNCFDTLVDTQIKVRGGWYELFDNNATKGDYLEFSIIDKDNILGLFSTYGLTVGMDILELKKFVRKEYINPLNAGKRQYFESQGASTVIAGLYMRICYFSVGVEDVEFKVMEKYHEI